MLLFGGQWALLSWQTAEATGWQSGILALIVIPLFSFASVIVLEKATLLLRRWRARRCPAGTDLERLGARRRRLQELTWEAL